MIKRVLITIVVFTLINISLQPINVASNYHKTKEEPKICRFSYLSNSNGGYWYDDFSDNTGTIINERTLIAKGGIIEDFNSYKDGQTIIGSNGWKRHDYYYTGTFSCINSTIGLGTKFAHHYCGDPERSSIIQSKEFNLTKGVIDFWCLTNHVDDTDHTSTQFSLISTGSTNSVNEDRLIGFGFNMGGFSTYNGEWTLITSQVETQNWYRIIVNFDCIIGKYNVTIYSEYGEQIGKTEHLDFWHYNQTARAFQIITGSNYGDGNKELFSCIDEFHIGNVSSKGVIVSKRIVLPDSYYWSGFRIWTNNHFGSNFHIKIYDGSFNIIEGYNRSNENEFDISSINRLAILDIHISIEYEIKTSEIFSFLDGWGVDWKRGNCWYDGLFRSEKIEIEHNTTIYGKNISILMGHYNGYIISRDINLKSGFNWGCVLINTDYHLPSSVRLSILDVTGEVISEFENIQSDMLNISSIDPDRYNVIRLMAKFIQETIEKPYLISWSVNWWKNQEVIISNIYSPPDVFRGDSIKISLDCYDPNQPESTLIVKSMHRIGENTWLNNYFAEFIYNLTTGMWEGYFSPDLHAEIGFYDIKIKIEEEYGYYVEKNYISFIEVKNNLPKPPEILFIPEIVHTNSYVEASIYTPGQDVESNKLYYNFFWYVNDEEIECERQVNRTDDNRIVLPNRFFVKGDIIKLEVYTFDGLDHSSPAVTIKKVENIKPILLNEVDIIALMEDRSEFVNISLNDLFMDYDNDRLTYRIEDTENISISLISSNGSLFMIPSEDWSGNEIVRLYCFDGSYEIGCDIYICVLPVNDIPRGSIISPKNNIKVIEGVNITFEAIGTDKETAMADLQYTWKINNTIISEERCFSINFTEGDIVNITCYLSDSNDTILIGYREIEIIKIVDNETKDGPALREKKSNNYFLFIISAALILIIIIIIISISLFIKKKALKKNVNQYLS